MGVYIFQIPFEMRNIFSVLTADSAEGRESKLKDRTVEINQTEMQGEKKDWKRKTHNTQDYGKKVMKDKNIFSNKT